MLALDQTSPMLQGLQVDIASARRQRQKLVR
jgi:hypothetical protein